MKILAIKIKFNEKNQETKSLEELYDFIFEIECSFPNPEYLKNIDELPETAKMGYSIFYFQHDLTMQVY